jgi:hypothetical protein
MPKEFVRFRGITRRFHARHAAAVFALCLSMRFYLFTRPVIQELTFRNVKDAFAEDIVAVMIVWGRIFQAALLPLSIRVV